MNTTLDSKEPQRKVSEERVVIKRSPRPLRRIKEEKEKRDSWGAGASLPPSDLD